MDASGRVEFIHLAPEAGAAMESVESVEAVAGRGLRGDRYFDDAGTWSGDASARDVARDATLFEAEVLDVVADDYGVEMAPGEHRRNLTVSAYGGWEVNDRDASFASDQDAGTLGVRVELPLFDDDAASFLGALHHGRIHGRTSSRLVHLASTVAKLLP